MPCRSRSTRSSARAARSASPFAPVPARTSASRSRSSAARSRSVRDPLTLRSRSAHARSLGARAGQPHVCAPPDTAAPRRRTGAQAPADRWCALVSWQALRGPQLFVLAPQRSLRDPLPLLSNLQQLTEPQVVPARFVESIQVVALMWAHTHNVLVYPGRNWIRTRTCIEPTNKASRHRANIRL